MSDKSTRAIMRALLVLLAGKKGDERKEAIKGLKKALGEDYGDGPW